ncbi:hypothetical protein FHS20_003985 [Phyllobacterium endophyticum]|nr:hypothetical protein [Phyllobacterium endophyticum]
MKNPNKTCNRKSHFLLRVHRRAIGAIARSSIRANINL